MKRTSLTLSLLLILFAGGGVGETRENAEYDMLPLQPFTGSGVILAESLLRCSSLYTSNVIVALRSCGYFNQKADVDEFIESEEFKSCGHYDDTKTRSKYAISFRYLLEELSKKEGFSYEDFLKKSNPQVDKYFLEILDTLQAISENPTDPPSFSALLKNDYKVCMDYRDYVDSEERK